MIPDWMIKKLTTYGNCYLYKSQQKYKVKEIEKIIGKKIRVRASYYCEGCGVVLEVVQ